MHAGHFMSRGCYSTRWLHEPDEGMVNVLKDLVTKQTTQYLEAEEDRVDDMIKKLDNMDEDDIEKMREVRKRRLKAEAERKHKLRQQGMYFH